MLVIFQEILTVVNYLEMDGQRESKRARKTEIAISSRTEILIKAMGARGGRRLQGWGE